jgi:hypothetical protein
MAENHDEDSIHGALGLQKSWVKGNQKEMINDLENFNSISQAIMNTMNRVKTEEFGPGDYSITDYEKKIFYSGFVMAQEIMSNKMDTAKATIMGKMTADALRKALIGGSEGGDTTVSKMSFDDFMEVMKKLRGSNSEEE